MSGMGWDEPPPRVGLGLLKRALVACVLIVCLSGAAVASAVFLEVDDVINKYEKAREGRAPVFIPEIDIAEAGKPQTIMILGSDERFADKKSGKKARSDTIILVRLDPDNDAVSMMSLPRDLKVTIPGNDVPTKINAAYEQGGARLTLRTVKKVLSRPGKPFRVNHVVSIGFESFQRAINYVGCVYYDVDRRYYNDNSGGENYAAIDIQPGYQRLCGKDSLDYVRHRHTDNDIFRAARQQDFIRQVKNQKGVKDLIDDPRDLKDLATAFGRYFDADAGLRKKKRLFALAKLAIFSSRKPVREVEFRITGEEAEGAYLLASREALRKTVDEFMDPKVAKPARTAPSRSSGSSKRRRRASSATRDVRGLTSFRREGEDRALLAGPKLDFPFYFPDQGKAGARYSDSRARTYSIRDEKGGLHRAYRLTVKSTEDGFPEYYGIQGTTWRDPPVLDDPDDRRTVNGRRLQLYYDGRKLRVVAWKTPKAVYWISNSLTRELTNPQMIGIMASLRRL